MSAYSKIFFAIKSILIGISFSIAGMVACELALSEGHRIDVDNLPPEAKSILMENPGSRITPDQWNRFNRAMLEKNEGRDIILHSIKVKWHWMTILPLWWCIWAMKIRQAKPSLTEALLIFTPSLMAIIFSIFTQTPIFKD